MENHGDKIAKLQRQIANFYAQKIPFKIFHSSTNSTRIQEFQRDKMVDVSDFNNILQIDVSRKLAIVEPNVPMGKLFRESFCEWKIFAKFVIIKLSRSGIYFLTIYRSGVQYLARLWPRRESSHL